MKASKIKTITIIVLAILLVMSIFTQVISFTLLGITDMESFKRVMLANEMLLGFSNLEADSSNTLATPELSVPEASTDSTNSVTNEIPSVNSAVVLNYNGIKVTLTDIEYDTFWDSYKLKFTVENNSPVDITITSQEEVVDGYMVEYGIGFYCEVLAGKKAVEYMTLYSFELEPFGISTPSNIEFKLSAFASDDVFDDIVTTDKITINVA